MDAFIALLKKAMEKKELGVNSLASISGVSGAHISRILNGHRSAPSPKTIKKLADALNVDYNEFMKAAGHIDLCSILSNTPETINPIRETFTDYFKYLRDNHNEALVIEIMKNHEGMSKATAIAVLNHIVDNFKSLPIETQTQLFNSLVDKIELTGDEIKISANMPISSGGVCNNTISLPVYGEVRAGVDGYVLQEFLGTEPWIAKNGKYQNCYMLKIKGDNMYPRYFPGDYAVVMPQCDVESGDSAIVMVDDEEGLIKRIKKVPNGIILQSDNHLYEDREFYNEEANRVHIIGKVVDIKPSRL
jgi:SOS-response transcriptional repressor LexA